MPNPDIEAALAAFAGEHAEFVASRKGQATTKAVRQFSRGIRDVGVDKAVGRTPEAAAATTLAWLSRVPSVLLGHQEAPLVDGARLTPKARIRATADALQVMAVGSRALLLGGGATIDPKRAAQAILHVAFGADSATKALRKELLDPKWPLPGEWKWPPLRDIRALVTAGTWRELLQTFARCGAAAQADRQDRRATVTLGRIVRMTTHTRACAGHTLEVEFDGFRPLAAGSEVVLTIPTRHACHHFALSSIAPGLLTASGWAQRGVVRVTLPADVFTGAVGFFAVPPPSSEGACDAGDLSAAAGMLQSLMGEALGAGGVQTGQLIVHVASHVEAGRLAGLPCAGRQPDDVNWLKAGPPVIDRFVMVEPQPVHPRGTLTLHWAVANADQVTIEPRPVAGSEFAHQLPTILQTLPTSGRLTLQVPCTRRWEGEYVLRATNVHGCGGAEAVVFVRSGFSHFRLGVGKADVTDRRPGLPMAGFAYKQQTSHGEVQQDESGAEVPLYARAFYIGENRDPTDRREVLVVVVDIWTCTIALKREVVTRLNAALKARQVVPAVADRFDHASVMVAGTHTHAAPGGYSEFALYNLTINGYDPIVFSVIVNGIVAAALRAIDSAAPGRLFVDAGEVDDCGANRSMGAFRRNPEAAAGVEPTDRSMLLLKLEHDIDNRGRSEARGALNWYAVHPTSLGMYNRVVSGDNKGWAAMLLESEKGPGFVAGFGNANAGDVSGNYRRLPNGEPEFIRPLGGEMPGGLSFPPRIANPNDTRTDRLNMQQLGRKQYEEALRLCNTATTEVTGRLELQHVFVDMSQVEIAGTPDTRTQPAALGVSFGAGSSEDSIAYATMGGFDVDAGIPEGVTLAVNVLGGITAVAVAATTLAVAVPTAPQAIASLIATLLTGAPMSAATARLLLPVVGALLFPPSRAFIAARVAAATLPSQIPTPRASLGTVEWMLPDFLAYPPGYETGHGEKPIMFPVGLSTVSCTPTPGSHLPALTNTLCLLVPAVLPLHLVRIGGVALAGVPAELTATAGRRLKQTVATALGTDVSHCAIAGYCNGYSGYVTTREEYGQQDYEGASTLFGEFTLMAYQQTFDALATGTPVREGVSAPPPLIVHRADTEDG